MTYSSGSTDMDTLTDKVADDLIATGAWQDADTVGRPSGAAPARRAVEHIADGFFVSMERVVTPGNLSANNVRFNEVRVDVSTGYDTGTSEPSGTVETTGIPAEVWQRDNDSESFYWNTTVGSESKPGQFWMWLDADGFTLLATWNPGPGYDYTSFLSIERNATKEYADGYTNFFIVAWTNTDRQVEEWNGPDAEEAAYFRNASGHGDLNRKEYIRPFNQSTEVLGDGVHLFDAAYRSDGNSKVYFQFPYYSNNLDTTKRMPIAQTKRWFDVALGLGLADGDLVDWVDGAETKTYLVKTIQSPDSAAFLRVAFRQA